MWLCALCVIYLVIGVVGALVIWATVNPRVHGVRNRILLFIFMVVFWLPLVIWEITMPSPSLDRDEEI
jgi:hypothetical protein